MDDNTIKMAREAGFEAKYDRVWVGNWEITRSIERLVALVRAAERERLDTANALVIQRIKKCETTLTQPLKDNHEL